MKCRICGNNISRKHKLNNILLDINNVYERPSKLVSVEGYFGYCEDCMLGQIDPYYNKEYFEEYNLMKIDNKSILGGGNSVLRESYYRQVLERLKNYAIDNGSFIDIGCGHGTIIGYSKDYFKNSIGIEPSKEEAEIARKQGYEVINSFFDDCTECGLADAFMCTQVLEEIEDIVAMVKNFSRILKPGGVGFVEVPNGEKIYNTAGFYDVYAETINYFSAYSLGKVFAENGFEIVRLGEAIDGNHLSIYVRKPKEKRNGDFENSQKNGMHNLERMLINNDFTALWGAGIKGRVFIGINKDIINRYKDKVIIIDKNKSLEGLFLPGCEVKISQPDGEKIKRCNSIIITAMEYSKEIECDLKNNYRYDGNIVLMSDITRKDY